MRSLIRGSLICCSYDVTKVATLMGKVPINAQNCKFLGNPAIF